MTEREIEAEEEAAEEQYRLELERNYKEYISVKGKCPHENIDKVEDYNLVPIDTIKGGWYLWSVQVRFKDGTYAKGSMQGDGFDLWAFETFEEDGQ